MHRRITMSLAVIALGGVLVGCGDAAASGPTLAPDVATILSTAATTMGEVETVRFEIERGGAPVYIDPLDTLEFVSAEGRFQAPTSAEAVVVVAVGDLRAQIGAVAIDGETWITNPITGDWEPTPEGYAFDPATLFDPELGWRPLLAGELTDAELVGVETRDGEELYHLVGSASEARITVITAGLVNQEVDLDLWLDPETGAVREAQFPTVYRGENSEWSLRFFDYGEPLEITIPDLEGGS